MEEQIYQISWKGTPYYLIALHDDGVLEICGDGMVKRIVAKQEEYYKVIIRKTNPPNPNSKSL